MRPGEGVEATVGNESPCRNGVKAKVNNFGNVTPLAWARRSESWGNSVLTEI